MIVSVGIIIIIFEGEWNSLWIPITIIVVWGLIMCWLNRSGIMLAVKQIETIFYGKPLDKNLWKPGEKKPKVKIVWRKKNDR